MADALNILIVEDVAADADAIEEELRRGGLRFRARRLQSREDFLGELRRNAPDVVLSDFTLPNFDALEALQLLQQTRPEVPFILVTGSRSEEVAVECIREGAEDYILKASLKRLPASIRSALQKRSAERAKALAEEALRRSEEQYRLIAENTHDLICLLGTDGRFLYASPSFKSALGYVPEELAGTDFLALIHPGQRESIRATLEQALTSRAGRNTELRLRHQSGPWRTFESACNWIYDERQKPQRTVIVSRDITQRKQAEETLRGLPRLIMETQEAERRRVARELHDSVNQILSSVKFRLETLAEKLAEPQPALWRAALKTKELVSRAITELRRISRNLRPSELDDLGLVPAIRSLCNEFAERTSITIESDLAGAPAKLPNEIEWNLYRIIQEALANIEKHARARRVVVHLTREGARLKTRIRDDGRGFAPERADRRDPGKPGWGLVDMKERAAFLGGVCAVHSAPGHGTEIRLEIPLAGSTQASHASREK